MSNPEIKPCVVSAQYEIERLQSENTQIINQTTTRQTTKTITAAEAHQIAHMTGCFLTQDKWSTTLCLDRQQFGSVSWLNGDDTFGLRIRIADDRPWHEQIWEPETYNKETDK